ncbi:hypothetical protein [Treponema denticola]|nr:hypothetical protein [Treponema denticola]
MYSLSQKNKIFNKFDEKIEFYSLKGNSKNSDNLTVGGSINISA